MDQFQFLGFEPTELVRTRAARLLSRLLEAAPSDAVLTAVLEWDGLLYHCEVEIGSRVYPIAVSKSHRNPALALDKAELALRRALERRGCRWSEPRGVSSLQTGAR